MSPWRNQDVMIAEEVTVTEGHDPGEAGQECSRHYQERPGWSGLGVRERRQLPSLPLLVALQV